MRNRSFQSCAMAALALVLLGAGCGNQTEDPRVSALASRLTKLEQTCGSGATPSTAGCTLDRAKLDNLAEAVEAYKFNAGQRAEFERRNELYTSAITQANTLPAIGGTVLPALPATSFTVKRPQRVLTAEPKGSACLLETKTDYDALQRTFEFAAGWWPRLAAHAAAQFTGMGPGEDEEGEEDWPSSEYGFIALGGFFPGDINVGDLKTSLKSAVVSEEALHTLGPWVVKILPTLVADWQRSKAHRLLADLWEASDANFDKLADKVGKYNECYDPCETDDECRKCGDEPAEVKTLTGIMLRRWLAVREAAVAAAGDDATKVKAADETADDMIALYRYFLAQAGKALGAPEADKWLDKAESGLKGADTLSHKDEYLAVLNPPAEVASGEDEAAE